MKTFSTLSPLKGRGRGISRDCDDRCSSQPSAFGGIFLFVFIYFCYRGPRGEPAGLREISRSYEWDLFFIHFKGDSEM